MKRISDKSLKRLQRKKRKIKALLDLVNEEIEGSVGVNDKHCSRHELNTKKLKKNNTIESIESVDRSHVFSADTKEMSELRKKLALRLAKERPKFALLNNGIYAKLNVEEINCLELNSSDITSNNGRSDTLTMSDIQDFIIACLIPEKTSSRLSRPPNWCRVSKQSKATKVVIFALNCNYDNSLFDSSSFQHVIKFETSDEWISSLLLVSLRNSIMEKLYRKSVKSESEAVDIEKDERVSRLDILLSPLQLSIENYPLIPSENYGYTKDSYSPVNNSSPLYSIDCEMCQTSANKLEITRVSVVNENCEVIYDTLVKPLNPITNYLTRFSGITKKLLDPVKVTLYDVQQELKRLLPEDAILCGQSLNFDLHALQLIHPYIIDTSVIYNLSSIRHVKSSLKKLSSKFLNMEIQNDVNGHDSSEDAIAVMKLVQLKLNMGLEFGDHVLQKNNVDSSTSMSLTSYLQMSDSKLNVYYDYIDLDSNDKSLMIFNTVPNRSTKLSDAISKVIYTDKAICVILDKSGECFIKF